MFFAIPLANTLKNGKTEKGRELFWFTPLIKNIIANYSVFLAIKYSQNGILTYYANFMLICFPNPLHIRNKVLSIISDFPFSIREI